MTVLDAPGTAGVWDAVVVGAGPAGSMVAYEMARAGASVLLLDRQKLPRWKVCGACLSPRTQGILRDAGLSGVLDDNRPVPLHTLRLGGWGSRADVPLGPSVALSRFALDRSLADAAVAAGATFVAPARVRPGPVTGDTRALEVDFDGARVDVAARVVVAADGLGSPFLSGVTGIPEEVVAPSSRIGFGGVFRQGSPAVPEGAYEPGVIHMAVGAGGYVGLVRQEDGSLDVAAALDPPRRGGETPQATLDRVLASAGFPALRGEPETGWRGTPKLTRRHPTPGAERVLAVGDAAGYVEPITGEGITWALSGARMLAPFALEAVDGWRPDLLVRWQRAHEHGVRAAARLCRTISWAARRPSVSRLSLGAVRLLPALADPVVRRISGAPLRPLGSSL